MTAEDLTRRALRYAHLAAGAARTARHIAVTDRQAPPGGLRFAPTPPLPRAKRRDPVGALNFLRGVTPASDRPGPNVEFKARQQRATSGLASPDLEERVAATTWYHTIELPGVTTPGIYDHRPLVPRYGLPARLDGKRCLDAATFDGFWAFELERRGGDVTALDLPASLDLDLPPSVRRRAELEDIGVDIGPAFRVAADALGSKVDRRTGSVYDLDPDDIGTFDLVHMADLLLHLERPWDALRAVRRVVHGELHLSDSYDPKLTGPTVRYLGGWNDVEWWVPSLETLGQWLVDAGFERVRILGAYQLNTVGGHGGYWRAILRAS